jgi:prophage DNA circulation protein
MMLALVAGLAMVGCEKKDVDAAKAKAKDVGTAVKDAGVQAAEATKEVAKEAAEATNEAADDAAEALSDTAAAMRAKMDKAMGAWQPSLDAITKQVEGLKSKVAGLPAEKKATAEPELKGIETQVAGAKKMLEGLGEATSENWDKLSGDFSTAMQKLGSSVKSFAEKYGVAL